MTNFFSSTFKSLLSGGQIEAIAAKYINDYNANKISYNGSIFTNSSYSDNGSSRNNFWSNLGDGIKNSARESGFALIAFGIKSAFDSAISIIRNGGIGAGGSKNASTLELKQQIDNNNLKISQYNRQISKIERQIADADNNTNIVAKLNTEKTNLIGTETTRKNNPSQQAAYDIWSKQQALADARDSLEDNNGSIIDLQQELKDIGSNLKTIGEQITFYQNAANRETNADKKAAFNDKVSELNDDKQALLSEQQKKKTELESAVNSKTQLVDKTIPQLEADIKQLKTDHPDEFQKVTDLQNKYDTQQTNVDKKDTLQSNLDALTKARDELELENSKLKPLYDQQLEKEAAKTTRTRRRS